MTTVSRTTLIGLGFIGVGCGLAAIGAAVIVPACIAWSRDRLENAFRKGTEGVISSMETAAATVGQVAGKVQRRFDDAARSARSERVQ